MERLREEDPSKEMEERPVREKRNLGNAAHKKACKERTSGRSRSHAADTASQSGC